MVSQLFHTWIEVVISVYSSDKILHCNWSYTVQSGACNKLATAVKKLPDPFPLLQNGVWPRKTTLTELFNFL